MSFLVYFFVLLVAAGSVIFGLDWTQAPLNPPPYATPAQTASVNPTSSPGAPTQSAPAASARQPATVAVSSDTAASAKPDSAKADEAAQAQAQAKAGDQVDQPETTAAVAHCNIAACSASYRSFRASDCTYQPYDGERRVCTKTGSAGRIAAAVHPRSTVRRYELRDEPRLSDRRDYQDRRGGWAFDFFGGNSYDDER
jgi:hypothetical protein